jgi:uroporphyrinogen-III synthase
MKIEEIKKRYKDEWVLVEVLEEDEIGQPTEVEVIIHSKARDEIYEALKETKRKYTYQFYTGEIPKKGYAVAFNEIQI